MEWLQAHWTEVAGVAAFVVIIGERVAAWTETKTDDRIFAAIHKVLAALKVKFPETK
jgi:hypothetical protein